MWHSWKERDDEHTRFLYFKHSFRLLQSKKWAGRNRPAHDRCNWKRCNGKNQKNSKSLVSTITNKKDNKQLLFLGTKTNRKKLPDKQSNSWRCKVVRKNLVFFVVGKKKWLFRFLLRIVLLGLIWTKIVFKAIGSYNTYHCRSIMM